MEDLIKLISSIFIRTNRQWKIKGRYITPSEGHIAYMLNVARKISDGESFESGGIMVVSDAGHLDVYVHVGEIEPESLDNPPTA